MIWLTWRQFRAQTIVTAAFLAALAVTLLVTGLSLAHVYDSSGLATCQGSSCGTFAGNFINEVKGGFSEKIFYAGIYIVYAAPAIIGIFWGAPLIAREIEAGTFRLAWNQSVSRARWVVVKLGLIGLAAMVTAGLLALMTGWWASPVFKAAAAARSDSLSIARVAPPLFGAQGIAPVGYAAFAFALGVTAGLLIRRTIPAMAVTLAGFASRPARLGELGTPAPDQPGPREHAVQRCPPRRGHDRRGQPHDRARLSQQARGLDSHQPVGQARRAAVHRPADPRLPEPGPAGV